MTDTVLAQLAALKTVPIGALKQKWRDLFETETNRFPQDVQKRRLKGRFAAEQRDLAMPSGECRPYLRKNGFSIEWSGSTKRGFLAAYAKDATVVAHMAKLDLDLRLRLHGRGLYDESGPNDRPSFSFFTQPNQSRSTSLPHASRDLILDPG